MRKSIKLAIILVIGFMFIGCGGPLVKIGKLPQKDSMRIKILYEVPEKKGLAPEVNNMANTLGLQLAAETTIKNGYKYFSIVFPKGKASNVYGSLINTPQDFIKTCNTNSFGKDFGATMLTLGILDVTIHDDCHIANRSGRGAIVVEAYTVQPIKFASYNANEVIKYLKKNKLYVAIPQKKIEEKITQK